MSNIRLLGPIGDADYDRFAGLVELALTPDELAAFERPHRR